MTVRPALPLRDDLAHRLDGRPLVLLLDIDGTLARIAPRPEDAVVPDTTRAILDGLTKLPDTHVVFVTGRRADDGRRMAHVDRGWVIGNHGLEIARPSESSRPRDDIVRYEAPLRHASSRIADVADRRGWPGVFVENKRWTVSVHFRLAEPSIVPEVSAEVERVARDYGLRITTGKKVLELRPPVDVHKGTAAVELADRLAATHEGASLFAAGDDRTDEDMFKHLRAHHPRAVTVHVGGASADETEAEFCVSDTNAMRELLGQILERRRTQSAA